MVEVVEYMYKKVLIFEILNFILIVFLLSVVGKKIILGMSLREYFVDYIVF